MTNPRSREQALGDQALAGFNVQQLARIAKAVEALALGTVVLPSRIVTGSDPIAVGDCVILADASGGAIAPVLPAGSGFAGAKVYIVVKTDASANAVTITPTGADTISGAATKALAARYDYAVMISYGSGYLLLSP